MWTIGSALSDLSIRMHDGGRAGFDAEFIKYVLDVLMNGSRADLTDHRDLRISFAAADPVERLALSRRKAETLVIRRRFADLFLKHERQFTPDRIDRDIDL